MRTPPKKPPHLRRRRKRQFELKTERRLRKFHRLATEDFTMTLHPTPEPDV